MIDDRQPEFHELVFTAEDNLDGMDNYTEYKVQLMGDALEKTPLLSLSSFGEWTIEGNFICVWTAAGVKEAYILPKDVQYINTIEVAQGKHVNEEEEDGEAADDGDPSSTSADAVHNG